MASWSSGHWAMIWRYPSSTSLASWGRSQGERGGAACECTHHGPLLKVEFQVELVSVRIGHHEQVGVHCGKKVKSQQGWRAVFRAREGSH